MYYRRRSSRNDSNLLFLHHSRSVKDARLIGGDHVLDVDEGVLATVLLEHLKGALAEFSQVLALPLAVVNTVANVLFVVFE